MHLEGLFKLIRYLSQLSRYPITSVLGIAGAIFTVWQLLGPGNLPAPTEANPLRQPGILAGVQNISISALGVLLEEGCPAELEDSATLRPEAAGCLRQVCGGCASVSVLAQVNSDVGEATLRGALEAAGLLGPGRGQLPPHRLLFCSTAVGKTSIVRQLSPDLHIDSTLQTVVELQRFVKQLLHVQAQSSNTHFLSNVRIVPQLSAVL